MRKTGRHRSFLVLPGKPETESFPADENGIALLKNLVEPWSSEQPIDRMFHRAFDRYLPWYEPLTGTQYDRRISWRYPRDGCFNRAELLNNRIKQFGFPALQKIFVFGNLATRTPDAPEGKVRWWYHVAPVTQVNNEILVIDPALDKKAPMPITQWLNTLVNAVNKRTSKDMKIAICDANAYTPMSSCNGGQQINDSNLRKGATKYLDAEWENMRLIGLDPYSELLSQR
jgi:hypothetical protein